MNVVTDKVVIDRINYLLDENIQQNKQIKELHHEVETLQRKMQILYTIYEQKQQLHQLYTNYEQNGKSEVTKA